MPVPFLSEGVAIGRIVLSALTGGWRFWRGRQRRLTPQQKLELRMKWKPEIEERLACQRKKQYDGDIIIRDMRRIDHYPEAREGRGISAWFKVGLIYTYERGMMVGLSWEGLKYTEDGKLRFTGRDEESDVTLMRTGLIPYECIESIDWNGDRSYNEPHIYCHFDQRHHQPYERIVFCDRRDTPNYSYWLIVEDFEPVKKRSQKLGVKRW